MSEKGSSGGKNNLGPARKAALGLSAAVAAAYGMYLWGRPRGRPRPATELPNALNLRVHYVSWRGVHYAYYARAGTGRPLVFLHSINVVGSAHEMRPLVRRFRRSTSRPIYALEWVGFGHSDRPDITYTPELLESQLEHFLSRVANAEGGADVVGLSLGAAYAAAVARRRPELIRSLVALEPWGFGEEFEEIGRGWARLLFTLPGVQRAFYERITTREALHRFARKNLFTDEFGVPDEYVEYGVETARVEGAALPLDEFLKGGLFPADAKESFLRLRQPLLIVHGTVADRRLESYSDLGEAVGRPNTEVVALPTGALPHWERPDEVVEHVERFFAAIDQPLQAEV
jgi:pimeloyl-ACP methyl ester carboxylesterase